MRRTLLLIGRVLLGAVFVYAAWTKLSQSSYLLFAMAIHSYQMAPEWAELGLARTLPWFELTLGLLLLSGFLLRYAAAAASLLLTVFFSVMTRSYLAGQQINCGCFGIGEALSPKTLVRDGLLLAVSLALTAGAFLAARAPQKSPEPAPPSSAAQSAQ